MRSIPASMQARAFRLAEGRWASRLESRSRFAGIEWASTVAFSEELNYFPSVWINLRGREPEGVVAPQDYDRVVADVEAALMQLRDPISGAAVVRKAWRRDELYSGEWVRYAPDIILELQLDDGYSYHSSPTPSAIGDGPICVLDAATMRGGKINGMGGSHRSEGVYVVRSSALECRGERRKAQIVDMGRTILALLGVEAPAELDGEALLPPFAAASQPNASTGGQIAESPYGAAEEREIAARLGEMGYLD